MSRIQLVALTDCADQPWRNGGGTTRDLLTWPVGATAWQLRVSVADIDRDGPFSRFDGVQRWFSVLAGAGVRLQLPGGPVTLTPADAPLAFDGADAPGCTLLAGPTRDLNLMARHDAGRARMQRALPAQPLEGRPCWRGLYVGAEALLQAGGTDHRLAADTLAWSDDPDAGRWTLADSAGPAWWLTLEA
ncbi:MAG: HutD family protein [Burkholderiaceae bacterium]|nr:HutD family protein [Burkholderiaceae bacterium]